MSFHDNLRNEIDSETGCTGAEMNALDCTVDEILWYESSAYRAQVIERLGLPSERRISRALRTWLAEVA